MPWLISLKYANVAFIMWIKLGLSLIWSGIRLRCFLRPRRFGKSLLVSMLAHYYDRSKSHRFEGRFGGTWIGTNPTPEHNQYMIIRLRLLEDGDG